MSTFAIVSYINLYFKKNISLFEAEMIVQLYI